MEDMNIGLQVGECKFLDMGFTKWWQSLSQNLSLTFETLRNKAYPQLQKLTSKSSPLSSNIKPTLSWQSLHMISSSRSFTLLSVRSYSKCLHRVFYKGQYQK